MKKILSLILVICLCFGAFACAAKQETPKTDEKTGSKSVTVEVVQKDGSSKEYVCKTDAENLEELLLELDFVEGDMTEYGLYITKVEGVRAEYLEDKAYWGINKSGQFLETGARDTVIADGEHYELVYTPAE